MIEQIEDFIELNNLKTRARHDCIKWQRYYLFKYLKSKNQGLSLAQIGKMFDRDHATVINGLKQYDNLKEYSEFKHAVSDLKMLFPIDKIDTFHSNQEKAVHGLCLLDRKLQELNLV